MALELRSFFCVAHCVRSWQCHPHLLLLRLYLLKYVQGTLRLPREARLCVCWLNLKVVPCYIWVIYSDADRDFCVICAHRRGSKKIERCGYTPLSARDRKRFLTTVVSPISYFDSADSRRYKRWRMGVYGEHLDLSVTFSFLLLVRPLRPHRPKTHFWLPSM